MGYCEVAIDIRYDGKEGWCGSLKATEYHARQRIEDDDVGPRIPAVLRATLDATGLARPLCVLAETVVEWGDWHGEREPESPSTPGLSDAERAFVEAAARLVQWWDGYDSKAKWRAARKKAED